MSDRKLLIFPLIFALVLAPVFVVALLTFNPGSECECDCGALPAVAHSHGYGLTSTIKDDMQLIFNVSPAATLYKVEDGALELCSGDVTDIELKHITVDVNDARLALGERLPVTVNLTVRDAATDAVIVEAGAPAMYAPGHGYHFGDNYRVPNGGTYTFEVTVSPVQARRLEGAQNIWLEPVTWRGTFEINADGTVAGKASGLQQLGEFTEDGVHVLLSQAAAQPLYEVMDGQTVASDPLAGARYLVVDVTDHTVNYEEKLPGATVQVTFERAGDTVEATLEPAISPVYGFHYGANVTLDPGEWQATVTVGGLDFLRHAGAAVSLARGTISDTITLTLE